MSAYILLIETYEILGSIARKYHCNFDVVGYFIRETKLLRLFSIFDWKYPQFLPIIKKDEDIKCSKYIKRILKLHLSSLSEITIFRNEAEYEEESNYVKYINRIIRGVYRDINFSNCCFDSPIEIYYNPRTSYCCHPNASKIITGFISAIERDSSSKTLIYKLLQDPIPENFHLMNDRKIDLIYNIYEMIKDVKEVNVPIININLICEVFDIDKFPDDFLKNCLIAGSNKETLTIPLKSEGVNITIKLQGANLGFIDKTELEHIRDYLSGKEFENMKYNDLRKSIDIELTKIY